MSWRNFLTKDGRKVLVGVIVSVLVVVFAAFGMRLSQEQKDVAGEFVEEALRVYVEHDNIQVVDLREGAE